MKKLFAIVAISLLSSTAFADNRSHAEHIGTDGDAYGSQLNETNDPGTRATSPGQQGEGDLYGSHIANPEDVTPDPTARRKPIDQVAVRRMNSDPDQNMTNH
jgi:hypothetical protein